MIPATERKAGPFTGDGANTSFPFAFRVYATADILATFADSLGAETVLVLDSDYSVTLNPDQDASPGGTVTYPISGAPMSASERLVLTGAVPLSQEVTLPGGGDFSPEVITAALDRLVMLIQQVDEQIGRAVLVNPTSATLPEDLLNDINIAVASSGASASAAGVSATAADASADAAAVSAVAADASADAAAVSEVAAAASAASAGGAAEAALTTVAPPSLLAFFARTAAPTGWLKANGAAISRATYAALYAALNKTSTVTISIATPGVVTWNSHGLSANDPVKFTTTGALPTGLTAGVTYYAVGASITTNTFQVSATAGGAAIATSGAQSGVHTAINSPFGDGDGSTTFNVPDMRGNFPRGWDDSAGVDTNRTFGSLQLDALQGHWHVAAALSGGTQVPSYGSGAPVSGGLQASATPIADGSNGTPRTAAETRPRNVAGLWCIKY